MTKQEAIKNHREMWNWIADKIEKEEMVLNVYELKKQYCKQFRKFWTRNFCFLCGYASDYGCSKCPVKWPSTADEYMCEDNGKGGDGLWIECYDMHDKGYTDWQKQAKLARQIANLPEKED